jgi:hypothetical protein
MKSKIYTLNNLDISNIFLTSNKGIKGLSSLNIIQIKEIFSNHSLVFIFVFITFIPYRILYYTWCDVYNNFIKFKMIIS